jgi:hypothetical protein
MVSAVHPTTDIEKASQRQRSPKINFREIFRVARFSTSAQYLPTADFLRNRPRFIFALQLSLEPAERKEG